MSKPNEERDIYYIPPNFLASGRLFGGMIRARNAIEACVLVLLTGIPIIKLPMSLTVRIIILCLLPLPLGIFGIIGFEGDSLSEFAINWVRWFIHRRSLYRSDVTIPETARKQKKRIWEQEATKPPEELGIRIKQPRKKRKRPTKTEKQLNKNNRKMVPSHKKQVTYSEDFVPVKDIRNGIIETEDGRYIRVLEVEPINFLLRSTSEQKNIVASFASWMKISPIKIQIKVLTKKADIGKHLNTIERDMESESKLGQQIRINRSRLKDTSDTNSDFDDFESAIRSGYFLKEGLANYEDFYYCNTLVTITADTLENLEWRISEVRRLMVSQDMDIRICRFRQEQALLSILPLCSLNKKLFEASKRNMLTSAAASCYPFTSFEMSDENGILLGVNQHNNSLVIVDIFNSRVYKNANMVLLGTSGAGKTFTLQLIALRMRRKGTQVFIIAPLKGHEFLRACNNIGGEFISISPASKQCINVCEIRKQDLSANQLIDGVVSENSILAKKIQQLHIFFSLLIPDISHEERQLLDEALIRTYAKKGITHNNESLIDPEHPDRYREMPLLGDIYEILMESPETRRMGNILNRLVNGSAKTFNQHTNVQLDNLYTVLDISELTGELLPVGMFVALDYVWDKAKEDRTKEKAIFIDEAWELIGDDDTNNPNNTKALAGEWVQEIFKIIRGYGGAAIAATQDIGDLDRSRFGKGILNVAKTKIILNLENDEAQRVQHILHLSDAEIMSITRFERGQGLISTNSNHITVSFKASPLEKQLITTDRMELNQILKEKIAQNTHNVVE